MAGKHLVRALILYFGLHNGVPKKSESNVFFHNLFTEQYSDQLASVMKKILYISEVASLGRTFERLEKQSESTGKRRSYVTAASIGLNQEQFNGLMNMSDDSTTGGVSQTEVGESATKLVIDPNDRLPLTGSLSSTQKARISQLLGQWEEPTISHGAESVNKATVGELLQFRRALEYLYTAFPFSGSFGIADKRESTIQSAQEVYRRLLDGSPNPTTLQFDVIAVLGLNKSGLLDQEKLKELIKLFRPDRDGTLHCIDFVKAVDGVYKELRLLRAAVANSSKIDRAFESILNFIFYTVAVCKVPLQMTAIARTYFSFCPFFLSDLYNSLSDRLRSAGSILVDQWRDSGFCVCIFSVIDLIPLAHR